MSKATYERLILNRYGFIETNLVSYNQCKDKGHTTYEYLVQITCFNKLSNEGFLIDNKLINHVMLHSLKEMTSCELLCAHYADELEKVFEEKEVPVCEMYISLKPVVLNSTYKDYAAFELKRVYSVT